MAPSRTARVPLLERRVWLGLLLVLAGLELFTRVQLYAASKDFHRFRTYPARARALSDTSGAVRVAFIGNSATDRGVDPRLVEAVLAGAGHPARADVFVADASSIDTWRFIFERYFAAPRLHPDLVVVTFYENDLEDGNSVELGRLAQFFTTVADWPEVFRVHLRSLDERVSFVLSSAWATYAASDRIRERVFQALVPGFQLHRRRVNHIVFAHERRYASPSPGSPAPRFLALRSLLDRASELGVRLCFVAYPTLVDGERMPYELPSSLPEILRSSGASFIDLRRVPALRPEFYVDDVHLTEAGRKAYSRVLGEKLAASSFTP